MSSTGRKTFPWDLVRSATDGCVEPIFRTFALVIAIQYFHCSVVEKSVIASAAPFGLLLSLAYASVSTVWFRRRTVQVFVPYMGIVLGTFIAAFAPSGTWFAVGILFVGLSHPLRFPSLTAIYRENYRGTVRGQVLGLTVTILVMLTLIVSYAGGEWIDLDIANYRHLFLLLGIIAAVGGCSVLKMPSRSVPHQRADPPSAYIRVLTEHPIFAYVLLSWFIFGAANLAMIPQTFELLSHEKHGFNLSPGAVAIVLGVVPELTRLLFIQIWARIFDRFHIITVRIVINMFWLVYMILFFQSGSLWVVCVGIACRGIGFAGGAITWNLWVTRFATPEETSKYMAIHTFMTGVRGVTAPYLAYLFVDAFSIRTAGWVAAGMVVLATVMLIPLRRYETQKAAQPVEV